MRLSREISLLHRPGLFGPNHRVMRMMEYRPSPLMRQELKGNNSVGALAARFG